jgi:hypothetical protein
MLKSIGGHQSRRANSFLNKSDFDFCAGHHNTSEEASRYAAFLEWVTSSSFGSRHDIASVVIEARRILLRRVCNLLLQLDLWTDCGAMLREARYDCVACSLHAQMRLNP